MCSSDLQELHLLSAGRQPGRKMENHAEYAGGLGIHRTVARRKLELCPVGSHFLRAADTGQERLRQVPRAHPHSETRLYHLYHPPHLDGLAITDMHQLGTYFTRLFPFLTSDEVQSNTRDAVQAFHNYWKILVPCVLFSTPLPLMYYKKFRKSGFCMLLLLILFVLAIRAMMTQTNNPFLYFQF